MSKKIAVKSTVRGRIGINLPELRFKRSWVKKGSVVLIDEEVLQEIMYDPGTEYLFKTGILYIKEMDTKVALNIEDEGAVEPVNVLELNDTLVDRLLGHMPLAEFKARVGKLSIEQQRELANMAVDKRDVDYARGEHLKELTHIDVNNIIKMKREEEAAALREEKTNKEG